MKIHKLIINLFIIICYINIFGGYIGVFANVYDIEKDLENIENEIENNEDEISNVENEVKVELDKINSLTQDISIYNEKLKSLNSQKDDINDDIKKLNNDLNETSQLYNSAENIYSTRLRVIYEKGIPSVFDILISSDGIGDFFSKLNVYTSVLEYDKSLISNMKSQKEYVTNIKDSIEEKELLLGQVEYDLEKSTSLLEDTKKTREEKVDSLNSSREKLLAINKILLEEKEEVELKLETELQKYYNNNNHYTEVFSGIFEWPAIGANTITGDFGWYSPAGYPTLHSGLDIGASMGTPVVAAESGKVITATVVTSDPNGPYTNQGKKDHSFSQTNGYGYGNYIMLDNGVDSSGNKINTLYAHLSNVNVKEGQVVTRGQIIGYSGNTGNSYGAHLHFEVRINSKCVDPVQYLK